MRGTLTGDEPHLKEVNPPLTPRSIRDVIALAETAIAGIRYVRIESAASDATLLVSALTRDLRQLGYVMLRAATALPPTLRDHLCHRHLAVHFRCGETRAPVVEWIRSLVRTSPRAHFVIEHDDSAGVCRPIPDLAGWHERVSTGISRVHRLLDRPRLDLAEALLASLDAEAAVRCVNVPDRVSLAWARLRARQGRIEEAQRRLNAVPVTGHFTEFKNAFAARHSQLAATGSRR
jgi:hypothetical protein